MRPSDGAGLGANTVRSEFACTGGAGEEKLGVHRFNPYRQDVEGERW
jgi:hypothetical protein